MECHICKTPLSNQLFLYGFGKVEISSLVTLSGQTLGKIQFCEKYHKAIKMSNIILVTVFCLIHSVFIRTIPMCPSGSLEGALARRVSAGAGNGARATIAAAN